MMTKFCQLWLSCKDGQEASKIANSLLEKRLVACAKQIPVTSDFRWQGKIENSKEILLQMESKLDLFEQVEQEIAKLHSYDTFALEAVPVTRISKKAEQWLTEEIRS